MATREWSLAEAVWSVLGGDGTHLQALRFMGPEGGLPSRFHVCDLATATIGVATLAAAELWGRRRNEALHAVTVDRRLAAAAFRCERLLQTIGWPLPASWDPITGDYETRDGWIRLHTNYPHHRDAACRVLGVPADRNSVADAVRCRSRTELEYAVVDAGGCAAALRTMNEWRAHPQGVALSTEALCDRDLECHRRSLPADVSSPLSGIRVLDLTRVIAGPIATRYLAAFGADVLRIDPPTFEEMGALLPETTRGKRCATLDLREQRDRSTWEALITNAHVLVHGYRPGAIETLGYPAERLRELNPGLVTVRFDAYGWSGPWAGRRGFDSLVQMSTGIAHPGHDRAPTPLPAQALDHATGYMIAAAVCRGLTDGRAGARLSLARTARLLMELGTDGDGNAPSLEDIDTPLEASVTAWGPVRQVPCPGRIDGHEIRWREIAGPLGRHPPRWTELK